jgi:hypothetical protein
VDYIKFTGGEAWLMDGMHRVEMWGEEEGKYTWS